MEKKIKSWLNRWGKSFRDEDFGYNDCDMIDSCKHDLQLSEDALKLITCLVLEYIQNHD